MATCEFAGGVKNVRGTICRTVYYVDGVKHTKSVIAKVTRTGKQKLYIRDSGESQRSTPVTAGEIERREKFRRATQVAATLSPEDLRAYSQAMRRTLGRYNGKKYVSVRGYVIARLYNNDPL